MAVGDQHFPEGDTLIHGPQRYLDSSAATDQTTSFIDYDTDVNPGPHTLDLRDTDHAADMHYWVRVTSNSTGTVTIQRESGSTKTISGRFAGQTLSAASSFVLSAGDHEVRIAVDGDNWILH